ncbi:LysE family translocator [Roseospira marina]|uniref:LysE family translocator n=1 Tax=Roseospira marina TaxID=140057 RepID=A0A5M6IE06_9PROT|nr:LysE family translocator [Roseospira marina]KAA5605818.1 LysE family translocator [Roseospira marina]MBB4313635.1 threonine/homoserine/homoserine lactone efflux protein [Roseospira marina]MBB5086797.1 threonine/homoserine/homoserine lactone efflux protein [Roseospira marina]
MFDLTTWLAFLAACTLLVIVPGPTVTVIIANSLRAGPSAGLMNVAGTQLGLLVMIGVLALGLDTVVSQAGAVFDVLRLVGAAYLIWLGVKMWRSDGRLGQAEAGTPRSHARYAWQGFLVIWSNPKALLFFGAFIPQFVDPAGNAALQVTLLGLTFMGVALVLDGAYAMAAGTTGALLSRRNVRALERASGSFLIGGGVWLALSRRMTA